MRVSLQVLDEIEKGGVRFEYRVMFLVKSVRVAPFLASLAAFSWRILLHLLCPDWRPGLDMKVRRHCAQIEEDRPGRVNGARVRASDAIALETSQ